MASAVDESGADGEVLSGSDIGYAHAEDDHIAKEDDLWNQVRTCLVYGFTSHAAAAQAQPMFGAQPPYMVQPV